MRRLEVSLHSLKHDALALVALSACLIAVAAFLGSAWGAFTSQTGSHGNELRSVADYVAPTTNATVVQKGEGGVAGFVRQGGPYRVYAGVTDSGNPSSGISTVNGNVSALTSGASNATLTAGSYTAEGVSYSHRSVSLNVNSVLAAGPYTYSVTSTDTASNSRAQTGFPVTVDNTAPTASNVQTTNKSGNIAGRPDIGDTLVLTYSEQIDPYLILSTWNGSTANVVVRIDNNAVSSNDRVAIYNAANTTQLAFGTVNMGRNDYVSANATFGATGTPSTMTQSAGVVTIVLGTASAGPTTASSNGTMIWSPSTSAVDRAGNANTSSTRTETGTSDRDF